MGFYDSIHTPDQHIVGFDTYNEPVNPFPTAGKKVVFLCSVNTTPP